MHLRSYAAVGALVLAAAGAPALAAAAGAAAPTETPAALLDVPAPKARKLSSATAPAPTKATTSALTVDGRYVAVRDKVDGGCRLTLNDAKTGKLFKRFGPVKTPLKAFLCGGTVSGADLRVMIGTRTAFVPTDKNGATDYYVADLRTGKIERATERPDGTEGNRSTRNATMAADGSTVAFVSLSDLDPNHPIPVTDGGNNQFPGFLFVKNMKTKAITVLGGPTGDAARKAAPLLSPDGGTIVWESRERVADDDHDERNDRWMVRDLKAGTQFVLSDRMNLDLPEGNRLQDVLAISGDGSRVVAKIAGGSAPFTESATGLYVVDVATGKVIHRVGTPSGAPDPTATNPKLSADGRYLAFVSKIATSGGRDRLVAYTRVLRTDLKTGETRRVGRGSTGDEELVTEYDRAAAGIGVDGKTVYFLSRALKGTIQQDAVKYLVRFA